MINDGIGNGNFTTLKPFAFWTQHVLPLVYGDEISYMETLGKMRDILNELIKNNNNLPEYIQQMIEEYISSGAIEEVIDNILASFILNVKFPPTGIPKAKGDGTTNDHDSIQGCIDYAAANGGGIVYLPAGKYLTSPLVLKSGVTLLGFGRYAVSLVLAGGATTHLITGTVSDAGILNMTLDAKMSSQVNRVDAIELIGNHIDIRGCLVRDCYTSINLQKDGTAVNICDVICEVASDACLRIGGTDGGLLVDGLEMTGLSTNLGVAYLVTDSNGDIYRNINIHGTGALGIDVSGSGNYFDGKISSVTKDYDDISGDNTFNLFGKTRVENLTGEVVESANAFSQTAVNGIERQGANISDNASNTHTINAKDVVLNPTNPLTYKTPVVINDAFSSVPAKDNNGTLYNLLVENDLNMLPKGVIFNDPNKIYANTLYVDTENGEINSPKQSFYESAGKNNISVRNYNKTNNILRLLTLNCPLRRAIGGFSEPISYNNMILAQKYMVESGANICALQEAAILPMFTFDVTVVNDYFKNGYFFDNNTDLTNTLSFSIKPFGYGNGILSDIKATSSNGNTYTGESNVEPRGYLKNTYTFNNKSVSFYCTHLGTSSAERTNQISQLADILSSDTSTVIIVAADWNIDFSSSTAPVQPILNLGFNIMNTSYLTFPIPNPTARYDNILVKGATKVNDGIVETQPGDNNMFDHLGYWVDLQF